MGYFNVTLILLKEKKPPKEFLIDFHEKLKSLNIMLQKDEGEFIIFNDTKTGNEKEYITLKESISNEEVINLICEWKGLGLLSYRHSDFNFAFTINYLTWDDEFISGFDIGFYGKELITEQNNKKHENFIFEIGNLVDYKYIIGDVGNCSPNCINSDERLESIEEFINKTTFEIDKRK